MRDARRGKANALVFVCVIVVNHPVMVCCSRLFVFVACSAERSQFREDRSRDATRDGGGVRGRGGGARSTGSDGPVEMSWRVWPLRERGQRGVLLTVTCVEWSVQRHAGLHCSSVLAGAGICRMLKSTRTSVWQGVAFMPTQIMDIVRCNSVAVVFRISDTTCNRCATRSVPKQLQKLRTRKAR